MKPVTEKLIAECRKRDGGMQINISRSGVSVSIAAGRGKGETIDDALECAARDAIDYYDNFVKKYGDDDSQGASEIAKRAKRLRKILESG